MHKPYDEMRADLASAACLVEVGGDYAHFRDPDAIYRVVGFTILEATDEVAVKYVPKQAPDVELTRSLRRWLEEVDGVPRFRLINRN